MGAAEILKLDLSRFSFAKTNSGHSSIHLLRSLVKECRYPVTFRSALVPPYVRKTQSLEAALPWLYLKGVSSGEMGEALKVLVGPDAQGLSPSTVSRLKQVWAEEYRREYDSRLDTARWV